MLSKVRVCTPEQLLEMSHEQANPKNAVVSLNNNIITCFVFKLFNTMLWLVLS